MDKLNPTKTDYLKASELLLSFICEEIFEISNGEVVVEASVKDFDEYVLTVYSGLSHPFMPTPSKILTGGKFNKPLNIEQWDECIDYKYKKFHTIYAALICIQSYVLNNPPQEEKNPATN